jgi:hypothetical protein
VGFLTPKVRRDLDRLQQYEIVDSYKLSYYGITVKFKTGLKEHWIIEGRKQRTKKYFSSYLPSKYDPWFKEPVPIYQQFSTKPLNDEYNKLIEPLFLIQQSDVIKAGFIDIRIALHELIYRILNEGWIEPQYPYEALNADFEHVKSATFGHAMFDPTHISAYPFDRKGVPGTVLMSHFIEDWGSATDRNRLSLRECWTKPHKLLHAMNRILHLKHDIVKPNLLHKIYGGPVFGSPTFFRALLSEVLQLHKPIVLDVNPGWGPALLATAAEGGSYRFMGDGPLNGAYKGLADFLEADIAPDGGNAVDVALASSYEFTSLEQIEPLLEYHNRADHVVAFISRDDVEEVADKYPPRQVLKFKIHPEGLDRLFLY